MKKQLYSFCVLMFVAFVAHAMINTQAIPYLTEIGYSSSQRGLIIAAQALIAMVAQFYVGYLADKHQTLKKIMIYATIILVGFSIMTFVLNGKHFWVHLFLMGNTLALIRIAGNILETWVIEVDGMYRHFGKIRSFGSMGWAISSYFAGQVIVVHGYTAMMWLSVVANLGVVLLSLILEDATKEAKESIRFKDLKVLFHNKNYLLLIIAYTLSWIIQNADSVSVTDYILHLNGTEGDVGLRWFIQALSEIPLMVFGGVFLAKIGGKRMMLVGTFFLGLRFVLYGVFDQLNMMFVLSSLQMISFPFLLMSQKELFLNESPIHLRSSGQLVSVAFTGGFAAILSPIMTGFLGEIFPIRLIVMGLGLFTLLPILVMSIYKPTNIT